jgi:hypothetical protein
MALSAGLQRTGWGGCSGYKPTLGELAESSAAAVDVFRQRLARGEAREIDLTNAKRKAAVYAYLAATHGAETKAHRLTGKQYAEADVAAFLSRR